MDKKAYIINLKFKTWQNQLWFYPSDDSVSAEDFEKAEKTLDIVGDGCTNSNEFFNSAVEHFKSYGFLRIQK